MYISIKRQKAIQIMTIKVCIFEYNSKLITNSNANNAILFKYFDRLFGFISEVSLLFQLLV